MKNTPSVVAASVLSTLLLASALQAQSTRESQRLLRRAAPIEAPAAEPTDATEAAPVMEQPAEPAEPVAPAEPEPVVPAPVVVETTVESPVVPEPAPAPAPALVPVPVVATDALRAEVERDSRSYRNEHYNFEMTDKGFLRRLALTDGTVLIDSAGAVNLQGSYVTPEGRRVWFYAGGVGNSTYAATVDKTVRDGAVVFDVEVTHPRFSLKSTYVCAEKSIDVTARFTPRNLSDQRGEIQGIYAIQLWPRALLADAPVAVAEGELVYQTQSGPLRLAYTPSAWPSATTGAARTLRTGETGVAFHFDRSTDPEADALRYTIRLP